MPKARHLYHQHTTSSHPCCSTCFTCWTRVIHSAIRFKIKRFIMLLEQLCFLRERKGERRGQPITDYFRVWSDRMFVV